MRRIMRNLSGLAALVFLASGLVLSAGCYPKGQIYGVGNEGGLIFAVNPPEAEVVLDGVVQGKASEFPEDRYLKVGSGTHRLELRAAGYETYAGEIYVSNSLMRIETALVRAGGPVPAPGGPPPGTTGY